MNPSKPFKQYREMDDQQRQKISQHPSLHRAKSEVTKKRISNALKKRWAATRHKSPTTIEDIMLEQKKSLRLTEEELRTIVANSIRKALEMLM